MKFSDEQLKVLERSVNRASMAPPSLIDFLQFSVFESKAFITL